MLRNQKQCLPEEEQMSRHSKGGQVLKRAVVPQKKKKLQDLKLERMWKEAAPAQFVSLSFLYVYFYFI
jgi:hypothetical protein